MKIFGIKDTKVGFTNVIMAQNEAVARRYLAEMVRDTNNLISKYNEDYEIYKLGEFNENTGEIMPSINFVERATAFGYLREQSLEIMSSQYKKEKNNVN